MNRLGGMSKIRRIRIYLIVLFILFYGFILTACQQTPEEAVVISKTNLTEQVTTQDDTADVNAVVSETWTTEISSSDGSVVVNIDAEIRVPETQQMPVYRIEYQGFSIQDFDRLFNAVRMDEEVYILNRGGIQTSEIKEQILIKAQELLFTAPDEESKSSMQLFISDMKSDSNPPSKSDLTLYDSADYPEDYDQSILACFFPEDALYASASFTGDWSAVLRYALVADLESAIAGSYQMDGSGLLESGMTANGMDLSMQEAQDIAIRFVNDIADTQMDLAFSTLGLSAAPYDFEYRIENPMCYFFLFTPSYCEIPTTFANPPQSWQIEGESQHAEPASPDVLRLAVDDSGVVSLDWMNKTKATEMITENVALLDFE